MTAAAATRRINRGRGHSYLLDGQQADGVTKILSDGVSKPALINWAANTTAGYAIDHWDELSELNTAARLRTLEKARFAERDTAAVRGTDVQKIAQRLAAGEEVEVPEHHIGHVDAYLKFVEDWQPEELIVETTIANRRYRYMGTLDLVARLADGRVWLLDWKTTASGIFPEAALQLCAYRNADIFLDEDGNERTMPKVDQAGCVWLRADGYDLIPVDTSPETYRIFLYAQQMAHFANTPREHFVGEALAPPSKAVA